MIDQIQKNNTFLRQLLFLVTLITIGVIMFNQLSFFVGSLLGAITIYVVFRSLNFKLVECYCWPRWLAGLFVVLITLIILSGFGFLVFKMVASELPGLDTTGIVEKFNQLLDNVSKWTGYQIEASDIGEKSGGLLQTIIGGIFNTTYSFAANVFLMLFIVYFMFTGGRKMERNLLRYSPFKGESLEVIQKEFRNMVYGNAVGIPAIMLVQGLVSTLGYWLIGLSSPFFWGFLTALCGLVPLVGSGLVYMGITIYYFAVGEYVTGIIVLAYGILIISNTDNLVRIILLKKAANTHPMIVIIGVILGIPLFGFWGIIFGPLLISVFFLMIKIYFLEYGLINTTDVAVEQHAPEYNTNIFRRRRQKASPEKKRRSWLGFGKHEE